MLKNIRLEKIIGLVDGQGYASLHELMDITSSSESTIRADLVFLEKENKLIRIHGGAKSLKQTYSLEELNMNEKAKLNIVEKERIAKKAASFIKDKMIIYIDAGTTTSYLCDYIDKKDLVVVTNSLTVVQKLRSKDYHVYLTGGELKPSTDALIGIFTQNIIDRFTFDLGFFGTNGVSLEQGLTTPDYQEANVKRTALLRCKKSFVLADSSKFDKEIGVWFAKIHETTIITDKFIDNKYKKENIIGEY